MRRISTYIAHIKRSLNCIALTTQYIDKFYVYQHHEQNLNDQLTEAKNNNVFDMFKRLEELLNDRTIDKIKNKSVRKEIEDNAYQITKKPYLVYKKITCNKRHYAFVATLLLPIGTTIVRPFEEVWIDKRNGYMDLYSDRPFLDVMCYLSNNMRVDRAIVVDIEFITPELLLNNKTVKPNFELPTEFRSVQESYFKYSLNQLVIENLNLNPRIETTSGIHVVSTKKEAIQYLFY